MTKCTCQIIEGHEDIVHQKCPLCKAAPDLLEYGKRLFEAARSWHLFHHGSAIIQCDDICFALPAMEQALARAEGREERP